MLYPDGSPLVYDGRDFHATLEATLEASGSRASLVDPADGLPERPDDSCPAGAGHPHAPTIGAARELAAAAMLLKEGVQVAKQAGHGRECSSAGGQARWVVVPKTGLCAIACAPRPGRG